MAEVTITIKAGAGYSDPWIVIKGYDEVEYDSEASENKVTKTAAQDVSAALEELRTMGAFSAVKLISGEFQGAPSAGVESVLASFPNAQVINEDSGPAQCGAVSGAA